MGKFASTFKGILNAKPMGGFLDRLDLGKHHIALTRFMPKESDQEQGTILEADFYIMSSTTPNLAGSYRGYPWFLDAAQHGKSYERDRAKKFIETVINCFQDPNDRATLAQFCQQITPGSAGIDAQTFGDLMSYDQQPLTGVQLIAEVTETFNKKKNKTYKNITWTAVPQTLAQVAELGAKLNAMKNAAEAAELAHPNAPGQQVAAIPHPAAPAQAPAQVAMPAIAFPGVTAAPAAPAPPVFPGLGALAQTLKGG